MIYLSSPTFDPQGCLRIPTVLQNPYQGKRRGSVTATLDGGVSVYDGGYSVADQTLTATVKRPSKALLTGLQYLVAYYGQVILCCEPGAFSVIPQFNLNKEILSLQFRIVKRLD